MKNTLRNILAIFSLVFFALACSNDDGDGTDPEPQEEQVHFLTYFGTELSAPNKVNVIFQLRDQNSMPLEGLLAEDVQVEEDGVKLNSVQNSFTINSGSSAFEYFPNYAIFIDINSNTTDSLEDLKNALKDFVAFIPEESLIKLYTYASGVVEITNEFSSDRSGINTAIDEIVEGNEDSDLYNAISTGISDLDEINSINTGTLRTGAIVIFGANGHTGGSTNASDIIDELGSNQIFSFSYGSEKLDSALMDIPNVLGVTVNKKSEISAKITELLNTIDNSMDGMYLFTFESQRKGEEEISYELSTSRSNTNSISSSFIPELFFTPDSFEIKTDQLRLVENGDFVSGSMLVRKDVRNDSVDFQLFSGFSPSAYSILFVDTDPGAIPSFGDLNDDPDKIRIEIRSTDFDLENGFQSEYVDPEVFERKYMVIRDDNNWENTFYMQMTLQ